LLKEAGWKILRIWEHTVRRSPESAAGRIIARLNKSR
jgi:very-short-patch-repair endonuclease